MHPKVAQRLHPLKAYISKMKLRLNINTFNPSIPPKAHNAQKHQQPKNNPKRNERRYGYGFVEIKFL